MSTQATIYPVDDGTHDYLSSDSDDYFTARAGSNLASFNVAAPIVGQAFTGSAWAVYVAHLEFSLSAIPAGRTITAVQLWGNIGNDNSQTDFTVEARDYDGGATINTADWIAGADLSGYTLLASAGTSGWTGDKQFTLSGGSLLSKVQSAYASSSPVRFILDSDRTVAGNEPTQNEYVSFGVGAANELWLVVTYSTLETGAVAFQGVGNLGASGVATVGGSVLFQGVGTLAPAGQLLADAEVTFQGVGTLIPAAAGIPSLDFTKYDGYLEGLDTGGAMGLVYHEEPDAKPQTVSSPLEAPRTDVGSQPTETRPEKGNIFSQQDFTGGAGQLFFHHEGRDPRRYLWSEGLSTHSKSLLDQDTLTHLHDVLETIDSTTVRDVVQFNDLLFAAVGTLVKRSSGTFPSGSWTDEDPNLAEPDVDINRLATSGEHLYAAAGSNGIHRRDTAGTWAHWSDTLATRIAWLKGRIIAGDGTKIYEVVTGGAAPTALETLPAGWVFECFFEAQGFVYGIAVNATAGLSRIHAYGLNAGGTALEKKSETPFPNNQLMYTGIGYLGSVHLGGGIKNDSNGFDPVLYHAEVTDQTTGALSYAKVAQGEASGTSDLSVRSLASYGEDALTGWSLGTAHPFGSRDGIAIHHLKNEAFVNHLKKPGGGGNKRINAIAFFKGLIVFAIDGDGLYYEDTTKYVATATLITSVADWQSSGKKSWDLIQLHHAPLPVGTTVQASYSIELPKEGEWVAALTSEIDGADGAEKRIASLTSRFFTLKIVSNANGAQTLAPEILGYMARSNPVSDDPESTEFDLVRYVRVLEKDRKDTGGPEVYIKDPLARPRLLQRLSHRWITLYEPGTIWTARVTRVADVSPFLPKFQETQGEPPRNGFVVQLVLSGVRD